MNIKFNYKKITILLPDLNGGGAEKNFVILANYWSENNINVEFLLLKKRGVLLKYLNKEIRVIDLNISKIRYSFFKLIKYFVNTNSDIILVSLWPLTSISILSKLFSFSKIKIILFEHQILSKSYKNIFNQTSFVMKLLINITYYFAYRLICVSNFVKSDIENMLTYKKKINVIYNPSYIENNEFIVSDSELINMWGSNNNLKLLCVGSLKPEKDHFNLINALKIIKNNNRLKFKLIIFGQGLLYNNLIKHIKNSDLENEILIKDFQYDISKWYSSCDIFILPSIHEGFANVIVEALSFKKKIISTKCGGPEEILENGKFGKLVEINNPNDIADNIINHENLKFDNSMLINRAKEFSKEKISDILFKTIR